MSNLWPETLKYAPVVICPYLRYDLFKQVISALQKNTLAKETALFLFSDAPYIPAHAEGVQKVRDYLHTIEGFQHVIVVEREKNYGPSRNYEDAFQQILDRYERYINIEDDIVTSPYFLQYMNDALEFYKDHPQVMAISAYTAPFEIKDQDSDVYFMQYFQPWGNAMWKKWRQASCSLNAADVMKSLKDKSLLRKFNTYSSVIISNQRMLQMTIDKKINAQDVVISANILNQGGYVVYPRESMSNHMGFGDGGNCTVQTNDYISTLASRPMVVNSKQVQENEDIVRSFHSWLLRTHIKLLWKYLITFGPITKFLNKKNKNKEL